VNDALYGLPVVSKAYVSLWVRYFLWFFFKRFPGWPRVWRVYIEPEVAHDEDVIPELMPVVFGVAQHGEKVAHGGDDGAHASVSLFAVGQGHGVLYHVVYVASIFRQSQVWSHAVVAYLHACGLVWVAFAKCEVGCSITCVGFLLQPTKVGKYPGLAAVNVSP
jgi:hypothetical protein